MKSDEVYRAHILDAIATIESYVEGVNLDSFLADSMRRDAVVRQLLIIGEASARLSDAFLARYPEVPWPQMRGMRNRLVHDYINVNWELV